MSMERYLSKDGCLKISPQDIIVSQSNLNLALLLWFVKEIRTYFLQDTLIYKLDVFMTLATCLCKSYDY